MTLRLMMIGMVFSFGAISPAFADEHPCKSVRDACQSAGFVRGKDAPEGKHLFKDCIRPLAEGRTVAGVTVADEVQACKAKREERRREHRELPSE